MDQQWGRKETTVFMCSIRIQKQTVHLSPFSTQPEQSTREALMGLLFLHLHLDCSRVWLQKPKFQKKIPTPAWRLKSRRNKKRIATAVCKWRDESNEPN